MKVEFDVRQLQRKLDGLSEKNLRYAAAAAINESAKRVQLEARANLNRVFTIREATRQFMERQAAIIKPFAKPTATPFAEVAVGQGRRLLLSEFEGGAPRRPFTVGAKSVAVPITGSAARPTFGSRVPDELQLRKLNLKPKVTRAQRTSLREATRGLKGRQRTKFIRDNQLQPDTKGAQIVGRQRTFIVRGVGVFQRTGPKDVRLLYKYTADGQLRPTLKFLATAKQKGQGFLVEEMEKAIANEIRRNEQRSAA